MAFQSLKSILSKTDIQAMIDARIAQDEEKRRYGVLTYGWDESCSCVDCGDKGVVPEKDTPCWCDIGREVGRKREYQKRWDDVIPHLQRDFRLDTHPNKKLAKDVASWVYSMNLENPRGPNLLLVGEVGTGKTGVAVAALRPFVMAGCPVMYGTLPFLMEQLRPVGLNGDHTGLRTSIDKICRTGVLVIDDLGTEKRGEWVAERLTMIVDERHKNGRPTIVTTNLKPDQLNSAVGERVTSRLTAGATILRAGGDDLRRQMSFDERPF